MFAVNTNERFCKGFVFSLSSSYCLGLTAKIKKSIKIKKNFKLKKKKKKKTVITKENCF